MGLMTDQQYIGLIKALNKRKRFYYDFRYSLKYMDSKGIKNQEENLEKFASLGATNDLEIIQRISSDLWHNAR